MPDQNDRRPSTRRRPDHRGRKLPKPLADAMKTRADTDGIQEGYLCWTWLTLACIDVTTGRGHLLPSAIARRPKGTAGPKRQVRWTQREQSYRLYEHLIEREAGSSITLVLCAAAAVFVEHGAVHEVWLSVPWQNPPGDWGAASC